MNENEFNQHCDTIMRTIEDTIDNSIEDIDCETSSGILTLTVEANGSKIIISRQPSQSQIWLAAKSGGYYFDYIENSWFSTINEESLGVLLQKTCLDQGGGSIVFDI